MKKLFIIGVFGVFLIKPVHAQEPWNQDLNAIAFAHLKQQRHDDSIRYYKLDIAKLNAYLFAKLNSIKKEYGLPIVSEYDNDTLISSCNEFANYLVTNNLLGHDGKDYDAEICVYSYADLRGILKNDNEAEIYKKITEKMFDSWMNSESHKKIILSESYTRVIVSSAKDDLNDAISCGFDLRGVIRFYQL